MITTVVASDTSSASEPVKNVRLPSASISKRPVDTGAPSIMTQPSYTNPSPRGSKPSRSNATFVTGPTGAGASEATSARTKCHE